MIRQQKPEEIEDVCRIVNDSWTSVYQGYVNPLLLTEDGVRERTRSLKEDFQSKRLSEAEAYMKMKAKTLQWIESVLFLLGWTAVMLKGADFPPPAGFIWVILTIAILSILQWYYLCWLLKIMKQRKTFILTLELFACTGL